MLTLNPSLKHHGLIGALLGIWGFLFTFFARPFEHGEMDLLVWIKVGIGFNLLVFLSYFAVAGVQKVLYQKYGQWNIYFEVGMYLLFFSLFTFSTYFYYQSPLIQGIYDFPEFFQKIIFNIILIVSPLVIIGRRYVNKLLPVQAPEEEIVLKGENKLDFLKIKAAELVCVSKSQNYVEIYFLEEGQLKKKLIRSSLKNIQSECEFLLQIHRSHLINPSHFKSWIDSNTISLTQIELPVSKTYRKRLLSL